MIIHKAGGFFYLSTWFIINLMIKKGNLYYPTKEFRKNAWLKNSRIYQEAVKNPVKFWEKLAKELFWFRPWKKAFLHKPPYFQWFVDGKINITSNIFEKNLLGFENIKNKAALIWEPEPIAEKPRILTYQELYQEVNKFANALKKLGVKKGDRVGIYLPMIPEVIISMLACAKIGAVHTVVFSAFSPSALRVRMQITKAKVLITADGYYRRGEVINLKQSADEGIRGTNVKKVVVVKRVGDELRSSSPFANARVGNEISRDSQKDLWWHELIKNEENICESEIMDSEDLFFVLFTSGTTGIPKGCCHTCGGYAVQANFTGKWIFDLKGEDILWCTSDPGWITGHTYTIYSPLLNGVTTLMFEGAPDWPTPDRWAQIIEKYKVTIFYTAPTAIRMFEKYGSGVLKKYKFKSLRLLGSVGEPIDEAAWLWFFREVGKGKCPLLDTWWQTESGGIIISSLPGIGPFRPAFTGLPFPGTKFDILGEKGKSLPPGKEGNLVMLPPFAPGLLRGIYKDPEKYLKTYWSQYGKKIYFTSDAAYKDKKGLIRIVGRVDDVIKVAGHRLTIGELEAAINLLPEITECAVVGMPDEIKGEVPVAFVVLKEKKDVDELRSSSPFVNARVTEEIKKAIIGQIRKEIGPIALPKEVYLVPDLPKTRSGKIMRRILRKLFTRAAAKPKELKFFLTRSNELVGEEEDSSSSPTGEELGDLSTLSNPESISEIKEIIKRSRV